MPDELSQEETARWLHYAHDDLASAELLRTSASAPPRHACQLAQQAAEKALKSAWVWFDIPIVKTHDIVFLQRQLPNGWRIHLFPDRELNALSHWAVESRYPGTETEANASDAETAVAMAHRILAAIEVDLTTAGFLCP